MVRVLYIIGAVGSLQIIVPLQNLEKTYYFGKESKVVLQFLKYKQCAGTQKPEVKKYIALTSFGKEIK